MTEDIFTINVTHIEKIYSILMKGETNPQYEVEMRVELIDALSNIEASLIGEKKSNEDFFLIIEQLRETLMNWDPCSQWFKQRKDLIHLVYNIIVQAKNVVFSQPKESFSEHSRLKQELNSLKNELGDLRLLINSLVKNNEKKPFSSSSFHVTSKNDLTEKIELHLNKKSEEIDELLHKYQNNSESDLEDFDEPEASKQEEIDPPLLLPIEQKHFTQEEIPQPIESLPIFPVQPVSKEFDSIEEDQTETIVSEAILTKLTKEKRSELQSSVISKMKSIITDAEIETKRHLDAFKEQLDKTEPTTHPKIEDSLTLDIYQKVKKTQQELSTEILSSSNGQIKNIATPTEIIEPLKPETVSTLSGDPYMQLLTLEAEKYRLEKESEKNETDFQEGSKNKKEFDETIIKINNDLSIVRAQIVALRKQLAS